VCYLLEFYVIVVCIQVDYNARSPLHLAVSENRTEIVKVLLEKGASTEQKDIWGQTPLSDALKHQRSDIAAALTGKGVHHSVDQQSANASRVPESGGGKIDEGMLSCTFM
jgi:ankyrin repeat protein